MAKQKHQHNQPKQFDVHRTLPSHQHRAVRYSHATRYDEGPIEPSEENLKGKKRRFSFKRLIAAVLIGLLLFVFIIGAWDARNFSAASTKMFGSGNLLQLITPTSLKGADQGRVNVLVVGYSVDDPGHPGASLTDSIMLLSMSSSSHKGYMLSVPRDLYVKIPGYGYGKINEAYKDGGMSLLEQIIENNFNTHVDYYALVNYASVRETVNALGGIAVNVQSPDPRGLYDPNISPADGGPLRLSNGPQELDGQTALNLTRARGDAYGSYGFPQADFNRTEHQRQVFAAIKEQLSWKLILDPRKNGEVFDAMADNVKTDMQLSEVRPLYQLFRSIPNDQLQSVSLNRPRPKRKLSFKLSISSSPASSICCSTRALSSFKSNLCTLTPLHLVSKYYVNALF
jgi:LCP family protein required for cell wall assembly